jgi:ppGpp synthetase/RelA/SpoT-type nucleotidyltranferase
MVTYELLGTNKGQTPMLVDRNKRECIATGRSSSSERESRGAENLVEAFNDELSPPSMIVAHGCTLFEPDLQPNILSHTDVVSEFLAHYRRQWDYYDQVARLCAEQCEIGLEELGIQAMVTFRAKRPNRLEKKLRQRCPEEGYRSVEELAGSIRDLAGVRIALYFPGDRREVDRFIGEHFEEAQTTKNVEGSKSLDYITRSKGYSATHYRIRLKKELLSPPQLHYCDSLIEIQVASVLMHAWAEVEHDLAYKPGTGDPSEAELDILHELNCLVHAGEIALERLQKAVADKATNLKRPFAHHFELAAYLYTRLRRLREELPQYPVMGRTDQLFELLRRSGMNRPEAIEPFVHAFDLDTENRPIVEQLIDQVLTDRPDLESLHNDLVCRESYPDAAAGEFEEGSFSEYGRHVGLFISRWACLEGFLRRLSDATGVAPHFNLLRLINELRGRELLPEHELREVEDLRHLRNVVMHGAGRPSLEALQSASERLENLLTAMRVHGRDDVRTILEDVLKDQGCDFQAECEGTASEATAFKHC